MVGPLFKYTKLFDDIFLVPMLDICKIIFFFSEKLKS